MSSRPSRSAAGAPGSAVPGGSTRIPEWSVPRLSSAVEQIIPSDVRPYVLRAVMVKSPGSVVPGNATATRSPTAKLVAPQTMSRGSASPTSTLTARIGFLNSVSSSISSDPADGQWAADRADGDDLLDLVADADQRLLQLVGQNIPTGCAGGDDLPQPAVRKPHQAPTPNGSENRTSPSTMSRISGIPLRNCSVRSSPMPNANPE